MPLRMIAFGFLLLASCADSHKNDSLSYQRAVPEIEKTRNGRTVKSFKITDQQVHGDSVTIYIQGIASPHSSFSDTLTFALTGDGVDLLQPGK